MKIWRMAIVGVFAAAAYSGAQEAPKTIIRTEKKLVLVDTVVTDKKGDYVRGLTMKDFRVWEDKTEQTIESFSFEAELAAAESAQKHYLVLFFDNSSMATGDQVQARQAALRFLEKNAGPNRLIAIVNFGGSLQVVQNFTADAERLKQVVGGVKFSATSPNQEVASLGPPVLARAAADFGARDVLLALRTMAKNLATVPGRKTLVFLSAGFRLDSELRSELTAVVDSCNKSNVAVYPIDVRGLVTSMPGASQGFNRMAPAAGALFLNVAYRPQHGGGGGASAGGGASSSGSRGGTTAGSGSGTGSRGGTTAGSTGRGGGGGTTTNSPGQQNNPNNPFNQGRMLIPHIPDVSSQQEVLYALASGTGGFVIVNTNDLLGGLEKIANEQNQYYVLGYSPVNDSDEGACHEIKVKVDRGGTIVRARTGYCSARAVDLLAGTPAERDLETRAAAAAGGNVSASMQAPFFYTGANTARVDVALEIPPTALQFEKVKGKFRSEVNILGIAYDPEGAVAAKFSDNFKLEFDNKKELQAFQERPMHYDTQFDIGSGKYNLKVIFSASGQSFGKLQTPLLVDPYDSAKFGVSAVAMSREFHKVSELDTGLDAALLADKTPLVSQGMQLTPSGTNVFSKTGPAAFYFEIYDPLMAEQDPPKIGVQMRLVDRKTGEQKVDSGFVNMTSSARAGNSVIPIALRLPVETLTAGSYRAEFKAMDTKGNASGVRTADFDIQQ